jgi:hypothetical protein
LRFARFASSRTLLQSPGAATEAEVAVVAEVGAVVTAVAGLLEDFTVEAVAGMAAGLLPAVAWPTWVMGGVAMHRALTAGLTRTP